MPRLFYGIDMPNPIKLEAKAAARKLMELGIVADSWTNTDLLHITVLFIGMVDSGYLPDLLAVGKTTAKAVSPFSLWTGSFGVFPKNRILWLGVNESSSDLQALRQLNGSLAEQLSSILPVELDTRPFRPHLTLARKLRDGIKVTDAISFPKMEIRVSQLCLFESVRIGGVLEYPVRHRFTLGAAKPNETR